MKRQWKVVQMVRKIFSQNFCCLSKIEDFGNNHIWRMWALNMNMSSSISMMGRSFVFGQQIFSLFHNIPTSRWASFAWQRLTRVLQIHKVQREAFCQHFKTSLSPFEIYLAQVLDFFLENWTLKRWRKNSLLGTAHYSVISFKTPIILNNITLMLKKEDLKERANIQHSLKILSKKCVQCFLCLAMIIWGVVQIRYMNTDDMHTWYLSGMPGTPWV